MYLLSFIAYILFFIVGFMSIYLLFIVVASWMQEVIHKKEQIKSISNENSKNILILIPAHNEEKTIQKTIQSVIQSIHSINYNKYHVEIIVIADCCTDRTIELAKNLEVFIVERVYSGPLQGKGKTLDWFMKSHKKIIMDNDYISIIDADSIIDTNFIKVLINTFSDKNILVAQSFYDVLPPIKHWRTLLLSIALRALHHTRANGRTFLGGSAGLKGNGMMFRSNIVQKYGWAAHSIAEDAEFSAMLAYNDIAVTYVPQTYVYGTMTHTYKEASEQRARWENGHWLMVKTWLPRFVKSFLKKPSLLSFDAIINSIIPPLSLFVGLQCLNLMITYLYFPYLSYTSCLFLLITVSYLFSALIQTKAPPSFYLGLFFSPVYIAWKLWIYITKIGRKTTVWIPSKRQNK